MNIIRFLAVSAMCFIPVVLGAQTPMLSSNQSDFVVLWEQGFPADHGDSRFYAMISAPDGGIYVAGEKDPPDGYKADGWVMRLDGEARVLWEKTFGGADRDSFSALAPADDGGLFVAGYTESLGDQGYGWVLRLDAQGEVIWEKTFFHPQSWLLHALSPKGSFLSRAAAGWESFHTATAAPNGGVYLAGYSAKNDSDGDGWFVHLDRDGELVQELHIGSGEWDNFWAITSVPSGGVFLGGELGKYTDSEQGWIIRLDETGQAIWSYKSQTQQILQAAYAMSKLNSENLIIAGSGKTGSSSKGWLMQMDTDGNVVGETFIGNDKDYLEFYAVDVAENGSIYVAGYYQDYADGFGNGALMQLSPAGETLRTAYFHGGNETSFNAVVIASNGDVFVAGLTAEEGSLREQAVLMRLRPLDE